MALINGEGFSEYESHAVAAQGSFPPNFCFIILADSLSIKLFRGDHKSSIYFCDPQLSIRKETKRNAGSP